MTKKRTLLRSQKKEIFEMLREVKLEPAEFAWSKEKVNDKAVVSRLNYRDEDYYFQFTWYDAGSRCEACPGRYQLVEYEHPKSWTEEVVHFRNWVKHLRREIDCPDPWADLAKYRVAIAAVRVEDVPNETISGREARQIAQNLAQLADRIEREFNLTDEKVRFVRGRFDYLAEAAMRLPSLDWAYSALGVCATVAMALSLDDAEAARLGHLLTELLGAVIRLTDRETPHPVAAEPQNPSPRR